MALKNSVLAIPLTTFNSASMLATYQAINTVGLPQPCILIRLINNSNQAVTVSYDGTTDHEYIPASTTVLLEFQTNSQPSNYGTTMKKGTVVSVKGTSGSGTIALVGYYQESL